MLRDVSIKRAQRGLWLAAAAVLQLGAAEAAPVDGRLEAASPATQTRLIELYTSEGCSSCPPADRWLNRLRAEPGLWREFVPVAFHVDYWNYIGWPDRFASPRYSARQRDYARAGNLRQVYTPGMLVAGTEWQIWRSKPRLEATARPRPGILALTVRDGRFEARFEDGREGRPEGQPGQEALELEVALLGFDLRTEVRAGENRGRTLEHEFVVLGHTALPMRRDGARLEASAALPPASSPAPRYAVAAWVRRSADPTPLQAVGGWLETAD